MKKVCKLTLLIKFTRKQENEKTRKRENEKTITFYAMYRIIKRRNSF